MRINFWTTFLGGIMTLFAVMNCLVTVAGRDYRGVLTMAFVFGLVAACCFAVPVIRGPARWRLAAVFMATPLLFVASDLVRRGPHAFGLN